MRIGYPCINRSIGCTSGRTFRLRNYSPERMEETVAQNLDCLRKILEYNAVRSMKFFRITSDIVPFASHRLCDFPWAERFGSLFASIGGLIRDHAMRISMHPDQFTLINSVDEGVASRSVEELRYHARILDLLGLDGSAKIQIHVGGLYGDRDAALERFVARYRDLDDAIKRRLVIENDDRLFPLRDCAAVWRACGVPVLFDLFHHRVNNAGENVGDAMDAAFATWREDDGVPMADYSSQKACARPGSHTESIDMDDFREFLAASRPRDFDLMLEIKDKERSAALAIEAAREDDRFVP